MECLMEKERQPQKMEWSSKRNGLMELMLVYSDFYVLTLLSKDLVNIFDSQTIWKNKYQK